MVKFILKVYAGLVAAFKVYPKALAIVISVAVALIAKLGFHVTPDQLVGIVTALFAMVMAFLHVVTVPKAKLTAK